MQGATVAVHAQIAGQELMDLLTGRGTRELMAGHGGVQGGRDRILFGRVSHRAQFLLLGNNRLLKVGDIHFCHGIAPLNFGLICGAGFGGGGGGDVALGLWLGRCLV
jgi:hypothetical protein